MDRRDFLKLGGLVFLDTIAIATGLVKLDKGFGLSHRGDVLDKVMSLPDTKQGNAIKTAWLKFNIAIGYAAYKGWGLTAEANDRFLYGYGDTWNITQSLEKHLTSAHGSKEVAWNDYYQQILANTFSNTGYLKTSLTKHELKKYLRDGQEFDWNISGIVRSSGADFDLLNSLQRYAFKTQGHVVGASYNTAQDAWDLYQENSTFQIQDYHDWNKNDGSIGGEITGLEIVQEGLSIIVGPENAREITNSIYLSGLVSPSFVSDTVMRLDSTDAHLLQDTGLAHPFPIISDVIKIPQTVKFSLPAELIE